MEEFRALAPRLKRLELDFQEERAQHILILGHLPLDAFGAEAPATCMPRLAEQDAPRLLAAALVGILRPFSARGCVTVAAMQGGNAETSFFSTKVWMQSCIIRFCVIVI
jgi:hypothetical protein